MRKREHDLTSRKIREGNWVGRGCGERKVKGRGFNDVRGMILMSLNHNYLLKL